MSILLFFLLLTGGMVQQRVREGLVEVKYMVEGERKDYGGWQHSWKSNSRIYLSYLMAVAKNIKIAVGDDEIHF